MIFMKRSLLFLLLFACGIALSGCTSQNAAPGLNTQSEPVANRQPVLVELYTSEGCSSCPPADRALTLLEKEQPVSSADAITLEFHVDYWDGPSWKDPFSSAVFTQRQERYAVAFKYGSNYTPEMVVDGQTGFVGSNLGKATAAIERSAAVEKGRIETVTNSGFIKIGIVNLPTHEKATVFLAAAEDDLASNVSGGENAGEKLRHTSVVRELKAIGTIEKDAGKFEIETALPSQPAWKKENVRFVIFVQEDASRKVIAVKRI